jgi:hypothetical protein
MRKVCFRILAGLNRILLPSFIHRDLSRLSSFSKLIIAYRFWVTRNSLD